jgi:triphosphoribosyl-dephospho-CoA synthase
MTGDAAAPDLAIAAQLACLLEVSAPKPGNVSPGRHFSDARYEDFLASAAAIGGPLSGAGMRRLGATIRLAVESTARWSRTNTNLGVILLLAPLAKAALDKGAAKEIGVGSRFPRDDPKTTPDTDFFRDTLRDGLRRVLQSTTVDDARDVYAAIRMAAPGGLGEATAQDVKNEPTVPLLEAMQLAASRDGIAREYATDFAVTFETGAPALDRARRDGLGWDDAVVETFLTLLAAHADTHIARRGGSARADAATRLAQLALAEGGVRSEGGRRSIEDMDRALRDPQHLANPGTTADLTAAAIFVVLLDGGWQGGLTKT